jgi:hypothetical protein
MDERHLQRKERAKRRRKELYPKGAFSEVYGLTHAALDRLKEENGNILWVFRFLRLQGTFRSAANDADIPWSAQTLSERLGGLEKFADRMRALYITPFSAYVLTDDEKLITTELYGRPIGGSIDSAPIKATESKYTGYNGHYKQHMFKMLAVVSHRGFFTMIQGPHPGNRYDSHLVDCVKSFGSQRSGSQPFGSHPSWLTPSCLTALLAHSPPGSQPSWLTAVWLTPLLAHTPPGSQPSWLTALLAHSPPGRMERKSTPSLATCAT